MAVKRLEHEFSSELDVFHAVHAPHPAATDQFFDAIHRARNALTCLELIRSQTHPSSLSSAVQLADSSLIFQSRGPISSLFWGSAAVPIRCVYMLPASKKSVKR